MFHVDACQAPGYLDVNIQRLGVDLLTFNGSKIYGPRGIGVLYAKSGTPVNPIVLGGSQEQGLRAGTENIMAIVGLGKAVSIINQKETAKISRLRDYMIQSLKKSIADIRLNGPEGERRLANNINISVSGLESETMLVELDKYGIYAGSGSACTSHSVEPSHVLKAIGVPKRFVHGALRFSLGRTTTKKDIDYSVATLKRVITNLRKRYRNN